jgi:hypothetical protein
MNRDYDLRSFHVDGSVDYGTTRDADADLDAEFWRDVAREERRMVFRCRECNGVSSHHPNCPSADDGQDDEEEEGSDDE